MATIPLNTTQPATLSPTTGEAIMVQNLDAINSVAIADEVGMFTAQGLITDPEVDILAPGATIVYDGMSPKYGIALTGSPNVLVSVGASFYFQPPASATNLYAINTNTALVANQFQAIVPVTPAVPQPPGVLELTNVAEYASYELSTIIQANNSDNTGVVQVFLQWYADPLGQELIDQIIWNVPIAKASAGGTVITGHGQHRGQYLGIVLKNLNISFNATINQFYLTGTQRVYTSDDWSSSNAGVNSGTINGTPTSFAEVLPYQNILLEMLDISVPASGTLIVGLPTYAGRAHINIATGTAGTLTFSLVDAEGGEAFWQGHPGSSSYLDVEVMLPRTVVLFECVNSSGANAGTFQAGIIRDRL